MKMYVIMDSAGSCWQNRLFYTRASVDKFFNREDLHGEWMVVPVEPDHTKKYEPIIEE